MSWWWHRLCIRQPIGCCLTSLMEPQQKTVKACFATDNDESEGFKSPYGLRLGMAVVVGGETGGNVACGTRAIESGINVGIGPLSSLIFAANVCASANLSGPP